MKEIPFTFEVTWPGGLLNEYDNRVTRRLSSMAGQYLDTEAYRAMLDREDTLIYEVYEIKRPETEGELLCGLSVLHPGKVGDEYFMTKGHFHAVLGTAEVYYCLQGRGMMVMETPEGDWAAEELRPGKVLYVLPRWAHRSVNTGSVEDLVTFFVYPAYAGHDYGTIKEKGFRKLVVEREGTPILLDNPRWNGES